MKKLVCLLILTCILPSAFLAQEWSLTLVSNVELRTWKLTNKVDKDEKGLQGATIKLLKAGKVIDQVSSAPSGDFRISVPGNGEFLLEVSYAGCNTKRFAISTLGVPENIAKDNFKPSYGIGGFIMARALPGVDYSYLAQPLVKVVYVSRGKFEDDNSITERSLNAVAKIAEAENKLTESFCATNRDGDAALAKPDCPLAKTLYEKAMTIIPGEAYPAQQLVKVGKCLQDKEAADKKAQEDAAKAATAKQEADKKAQDKAKEDADKAASAKKEADSKAVSDAVAKVKADQEAKNKEMNEQLAKAAEAEAKKKAAAEKAAEKVAEKKAAEKKPAPAAAEPPKAVSAPQAATATDSKTKSSILKVKEKTEEDLEAEKRQAGKAKSEAEDAAAIREDAAKAAAKKAEKEKKYQEHLAKEREEEQKRAEEQKAKDKAEAEKVAEERRKKAEDEQKKRADQEAKDKEEAKKDAEEAAARAKEAQEAQDKEEAERAAKEKEDRKKTYDKIEERKANGKGNASYHIPPPLGSANMYKEKIKTADELFSAKNYALAKTKYEEALKAKPNDEYATGKLAEIAKLMNP